MELDDVQPKTFICITNPDEEEHKEEFNHELSGLITKRIVSKTDVLKDRILAVLDIDLPFALVRMVELNGEVSIPLHVDLRGRKFMKLKKSYCRKLIPNDWYKNMFNPRYSPKIPEKKSYLQVITTNHMSDWNSQPKPL